MYNLSKCHGKWVCPECNERKIIFVPHPQDERQEVFICSECADYVQYVIGEVETGRATENQKGMFI